MSSNGGAVVTQNNETHINGKTYVFTWVVKNFNFDFPLSPGEYIMSPWFRTTLGLFQLKLYPGGADYNHEEYVSVVVFKQHQTYNTRSVMSLVNMNGEEDFHNSGIIHILSGDDGELIDSLKEFVKRRDVTRMFLPNGHLTIKWKLYFYIGVESVESSPTNSTIQSMQNLAEARRLAEFDKFEKLLKDKRLSDIEVIVGTKQFYAHKCILAARSRYFAAMFESNMKEEKEGKIRISNVSANTMEEILRFIYTGKINVEQTIITDLLIVADMYGLDGLSEICEEAIISNISLENIGSILTVTDRLSNAKKLKDSAIEFLTKNGKEVSGNESFRKALNSLSPSFMAEVINIMISKI